MGNRVSSVPCKDCGKFVVYAKGLCSYCYEKERRKKYYTKHPEKLKEKLEKFHKSKVCKILRKHAEDLKDDPEHLTTEFLQNMIGIKCEKVEGNMNTIIGKFKDCVTNEVTEAELEYEINEQDDHRLVFQLIDGPTGYESFYIDDENLKAMSERGWRANVGTPNRYDELRIPAEEMKKVYDELKSKGMV